MSMFSVRGASRERAFSENLPRGRIKRKWKGPRKFFWVFLKYFNFSSFISSSFEMHLIRWGWTKQWRYLEKPSFWRTTKICRISYLPIRQGVSIECRDSSLRTSVSQLWAYQSFGNITFRHNTSLLMMEGWWNYSHFKHWVRSSDKFRRRSPVQNTGRISSKDAREQVTYIHNQTGSQ